jgi:hypothetical protein
VTKTKSKTCKIYKEKFSIPKNHSNASFKLINQSFTSVRISSQAIEVKLGRKKEEMAISDNSYRNRRELQCSTVRRSRVVAIGHSVIDVLSLMSTIDSIDVMISWYDELSLISTILCYNIMVDVKQLDDMKR